MLNPWFAVTLEFTRLGFEAQNVIALRLMRLANGGVAGQAEAHRMVNEKITALGEAAIAATLGVATGKSNLSTVRSILSVYKKRVRTNKCRLSR
jgi:hypothetical protein